MRAAPGRTSTRAAPSLMLSTRTLSLARVVMLTTLSVRSLLSLLMPPTRLDVRSYIAEALHFNYLNFYTDRILKKEDSEEKIVEKVIGRLTEKLCSTLCFLYCISAA